MLHNWRGRCQTPVNDLSPSFPGGKQNFVRMGMLSVLISLGMSSRPSSGSTLAVLASGKPVEAAHKALTEACPATNPREMATGDMAGWVGDRRGKRWLWGVACMLREVWGQRPPCHGQWVHVHPGTQQHLHLLKFGPRFGWGGVTLQPPFMRKRRRSLSLLSTWGLAMPRVTSPGSPLQLQCSCLGGAASKAREDPASASAA